MTNKQALVVADAIFNRAGVPALQNMFDPCGDYQEQEQEAQQ